MGYTCIYTSVCSRSHAAPRENRDPIRDQTCVKALGALIIIIRDCSPKKNILSLFTHPQTESISHFCSTQKMIFWRVLVNKQLTVAIVFRTWRIKKDCSSSERLVTHILFKICICVQQNKKKNGFNLILIFGWNNPLMSKLSELSEYVVYMTAAVFTMTCTIYLIISSILNHVLKQYVKK